MINKGSEIDPIYQIMLQSTRHGHFLNSYFAQLPTVKTCHVKNLASDQLSSIKKWK